MSARRSELTRQAARLFAEKGYHGTSVGDIAEALGVQKGSLYSHIASKEDLLFDTLMEGAAAFHAALDAIPDDAAAGREDPARAARAPPRGRRAARRRHRLRPGVALPRTATAATGSSPSGTATRSGSASCSARAATSATSAPTSTRAPRSCCCSRRRTGPTRGSSPAATPTSSPTASSRCSSTACAATRRRSSPGHVVRLAR